MVSERNGPGKSEIVGSSPHHLTLFQDNIYFSTIQIITNVNFD